MTNLQGGWQIGKAGWGGEWPHVDARREPQAKSYVDCYVAAPNLALADRG
jgi:hypothetical protein